MRLLYRIGEPGVIWFTQDMFITLKNNIASEMSNDQIIQAEQIIEKCGS